MVHKAYKEMKKITDLSELDQFVSSLKTVYNGILQRQEWTGLQHKGSAFKASLYNVSTPKAPSKSVEKPRLPFPQWWDTQVCQLPGCGGKHPTKFHHDLEARNRPRNVRRPSSNYRKQQDKGNTEKRTPRFKSDEAKTKYRKQMKGYQHGIHQASIEAFVEEDHDLVAHLADEKEVESEVEEVNVGEVDEDDEETDGETEAMVNAAISSMLNW